MTFRNQELTIRNKSNKDVRVFGRLTIKAKTTVEVFSKLANVSADDIFREFSTSGDLYREVNVKGSLEIVSHNLSFAPPSTTQTASATNTLSVVGSDGGLVDTEYDYDFIKRVFGNPNYESPLSTITIYVRTTGNDTTGDGGSSNPYRQPQRALDDIPDGAVGDFIVDCGAGTFEAPYFKGRPGNGRLTITVIGSRSESGKIELSNPSWSNVTDKNAQVRANIGAYSETITNSSYWLERTDNGIIRGSTVLASSSPNLDVVTIDNGQDPSNEVAIHPFATVFENGANRQIGVASEDSFWLGFTLDRDEESSFGFVGIDFDIGNVPTFFGSYIDGCRIRAAAVFRNCALHTSCDSVILYMHTRLNTGIQSPISGLFLGGIRIEQCQLGVIGSCVTRTAGTQFTLKNTAMGASGPSFGGGGFGYCDFEGSGTYVIQNISFCTIEFYGACSVSGGATTFLELDGGSILNGGLNINITGEVTGNAVVLKNGSKAIEAKQFFDGTLTSSGGSEIVVGSNSGIDFSALPDNDFVTGAGAKNAASQGCFAN